jgi:alpha-D-ribose 1-methylphosphonate 5-triphosphate synthase subunit PhnG
MSAKLDNIKRRGTKMKPLSRMTAEELKEIVEDAVERKLYEIIEDPDKGLKLKPQVRKRLRSTLKAERKGEKGISAARVAKELGLRW